MRFTLPALALAVAMSVAATAQPKVSTERRRAAVAELQKEAERRAFVVKSERDLAAALKLKRDAKGEERLKSLREEIRGFRMDKPEDFAPPLTFGAAGEVGTFPHHRCRVAAVIDKRTAILETRTNKPGAERDDDIAVVVYGVDASKWVDGLAVDSPAGIWIVGTEKRGGRTVFALARLELTKEESDTIMKAAKP